MAVGHSRHLRALLSPVTMSMMAGVAISVLLAALVLTVVGSTVPAKAASGGDRVIAISLQAAVTAAKAACPSAGETAAPSHTVGHCSAPCGPQLGTNVSYAGPWPFRSQRGRLLAANTRRHLRKDRPEPFPPRHPNSA